MVGRMRSFNVSCLPWLPSAPENFQRLYKDAADARSGQGLIIRRLATHQLNMNQLTLLARSIDAARLAGDDLSPLVPFRLAVLSNATTELLNPALVASAARHGVVLEIVSPPFGQVMQEALNPASLLNSSNPHAVLLALDHRAFPFEINPAQPEKTSASIDEALAFIEMIGHGIKNGCAAQVIYQSVVRPPETVFGSLDFVLAGTWRSAINEFNTRLAGRVRGTGDILLDVAGIAETVGLDVWHDPVQWCFAKLSMAQMVGPLYADHVGRLLGAIRGKSRRCLVLDLDNMLWGGVIGDDGLDRITLGQGSPAGEAFLAVQQMALDLRNRGIMLAVCTKNDDTTARLPFRKHPEMLLKEHHIAVFQANWTDKASNLEAIAKTLDIGLDTLVFLDDNPAERAQVRQTTPEVAVPELPEDPALYPKILLSAGYFEAITFSEEDQKRADQYRANAQRAVFREQAHDLDHYLKSLGMVMTCAPFDPVNRARITQLINKSNQFNLTTRRYTETEVASLESNRTMFTLQVRLADIFGDNGIISIIICRRNDPKWEVDTWLMSCRVIGRQVERAVLNEVATAAQSAGATTLVGRYIPTDRNAMVQDHYANLGFVRIAGQDGTPLWSLDITDYKPLNVPITVKHEIT